MPIKSKMSKNVNNDIKKCQKGKSCQKAHKLQKCLKCKWYKNVKMLNVQKSHSAKNVKNW